VFDLLPAAPRTPAVAPHEARFAGASAADSLRLLFPPPGAELSADGVVTIRVMGGRRPLTFLVDGGILPSDGIHRDVAWHPQGAGFYHLAVLDADGSIARSTVRVRATP
jgi:penicillin-binding protein 1C